MISTKQALKRAIDSAARKKCLDRPKYKAIEAAKQCLTPNKESIDATDFYKAINFYITLRQYSVFIGQEKI